MGIILMRKAISVISLLLAAADVNAIRAKTEEEMPVIVLQQADGGRGVEQFMENPFAQ